MPIYSHSKLATYEMCPRQYKLKYIDRKRPPEGEESIEAFLGSRVHETLEKLYRELILTKMNTLDELLEYYRNRWEKNWHDNVTITKKGFNKNHYYDTGSRAISNYYRRHYPFDQSKTLATERQIVFKIEDYTMIGFIDRLSHDGKGVYEIHDYKTSAYLPSQGELDRNRQLALYQIGVREHFRDAKDIVLKWHYLVHDKEFTSTRTDAQLKELREEVVSLIETIEKDTTFEPIESGYCDWCELDIYCPARRHAIEVEELPLNRFLKEEGVALVNAYASTKAKIRELREQQRQLELELDLIEEAAVEYARGKELTTITGSDYMLRISEGEGYRFPHADEEGREALEEYLKRVGLWEKASMLNIRRLEKMVEDGEVEKKILEGLTRFAEKVNAVKIKLVKKREKEE